MAHDELKDNIWTGHPSFLDTRTMVRIVIWALVSTCLTGLAEAQGGYDTISKYLPSQPMHNQWPQANQRASPYQQPAYSPWQQVMQGGFHLSSMPDPADPPDVPAPAQPWGQQNGPAWQQGPPTADPADTPAVGAPGSPGSSTSLLMSALLPNYPSADKYKPNAAVSKTKAGQPAPTAPKAPSPPTALPSASAPTASPSLSRGLNDNMHNYPSPPTSRPSSGGDHHPSKPKPSSMSRPVSDYLPSNAQPSSMSRPVSDYLPSNAQPSSMSRPVSDYLPSNAQPSSMSRPVSDYLPSNAQPSSMSRPVSDYLPSNAQPSSMSRPVSDYLPSNAQPSSMSRPVSDYLPSNAQPSSMSRSVSDYLPSNAPSMSRSINDYLPSNPSSSPSVSRPANGYPSSDPYAAQPGGGAQWQGGYPDIPNNFFAPPSSNQGPRNSAPPAGAVRDYPNTYPNQGQSQMQPQPQPQQQPQQSQPQPQPKPQPQPQPQPQPKPQPQPTQRQPSPQPYQPPQQAYQPQPANNTYGFNPYPPRNPMAPAMPPTRPMMPRPPPGPAFVAWQKVQPCMMSPAMPDLCRVNGDGLHVYRLFDVIEIAKTLPRVPSCYRNAPRADCSQPHQAMALWNRDFCRCKNNPTAECIINDCGSVCSNEFYIGATRVLCE
ncbi:vegetative cell wall protein gp1-like isoform X10 [Haliotis rufescens]|uniref:vegetative cell wall protein gp1-like isoform X10 n=1 Tax=Haliotis rufescens TaxID=6454 RepID=UPI00201ED7EC|nr:vegetative cell wall protein gp1-like isoform X10 [Haliotis rufescens]